MTRLCDLAALVRSKNAGPFTLTFDVMFDSPEKYTRVKALDVITPSVISEMYGVPVEVVQLYYHDKALAVKVSIPRSVSSGAPLDNDVYGAQQHGPLAELEIANRKAC